MRNFPRVSPLLLIFAATTLVLAACGSADLEPSGETTSSMSAPVSTTEGPSGTTTAPTTTASPTTTTTAPPVVIDLTEGWWPDSVDELLIADGTRVVRVGASGVVDTEYEGKPILADEDRRGGLAVLSADLKDNQLIPTMYWQKAGDMGAAFIGRYDDLDFMGVVEVPTVWPGPGFFAYGFDTNNVPGDTCVGYVPLRSKDGSFIDMEGSFVCRRAPEQITAVDWSGRYFAMAVADGRSTSFEFDTPDGRRLEFLLTPQPTAAAVNSLAVAEGTNLIAYTETAGSEATNATYLVVFDLNTGVELLRTPVAEAGSRVVDLDMTADVVVVSRRGLPAPAATDPMVKVAGEVLPALIVDIATGTIAPAPVPGGATIAGLTPTAPALLPPRVSGETTDIVVTSPLDHARTDEATVRFTGKTVPGNSVNAAGRYEAAVAEDGTWSVVLTLTPGSNVATFEATAPGGAMASTSVAVLYQPDDWRGMVFQLGLTYGQEVVDHNTFYDVWTSPAQPQEAWGYMVSGGMGEDGGEWQVFAASTSPPVEAGFDTVNMVWLSGTAYHDRGVWSYVVRDVVTVDTPGWLYYCTGDTVVLGDGDGNQVKAWRVDAERGRLVAVDPEGLECEEIGC